MSDPSREGFFDRLDALMSASEVVIDRAAGTAHPRFTSVIYPLDYGYLAGTTSSDGEGIDVFVGSARGVGIIGVALIADVAKAEVEIKILLDCTESEQRTVLGFLRDTLRIGGHWVPRGPTPTRSPR